MQHSKNDYLKMSFATPILSDIGKYIILLENHSMQLDICKLLYIMEFCIYTTKCAYLNEYNRSKCISMSTICSCLEAIYSS